MRIPEILRIIIRNRKALIGLCMLSFFIFLAVIGPLFIPLNMKPDMSKRLLPPSLEHPLGTDYFGVDILQQLVHGASSTLLLAFLISLFAILIGLFIGLLAGYLEGFPQQIMKLVINLFLIIPSYPSMLVLASLIREANVIIASTILAIFMWAGFARMVSSIILSLKARPFIEASKALGLGTTYILSKEMFPHIAPYVAINFVGTFRAALEASMGLMFLGLLKYNPLHWGVLLNLAIFQTGSIYVPEAIHYPLSIMIFITLLILSATLLSYGLEEYFRPELRGYE